MAYEFYGYPADYLERYRAGIEKVGKEDVARAAAKYLHKDKLAVLVVGNTADFDKPLSSLGPVNQRGHHHSAASWRKRREGRSARETCPPQIQKVKP